MQKTFLNFHPDLPNLPSLGTGLAAMDDFAEKHLVTAVNTEGSVRGEVLIQFQPHPPPGDVQNLSGHPSRFFSEHHDLSLRPHIHPKLSAPFHVRAYRQVSKD